jgi:hypothetical protein
MPLITLRRIGSAVVVSVAVALLAACAGTRIDHDATPAQLEAKAVVVLSVSHDLGAAGAANAIFYLDEGRYPGRVVMQSMQSTIPGVAAKNEFGDRYGHVLVLEVEPGHHTIAQWQVASGGFRIFPAKGLKPLEFDVKQGEALYIGDLHAQLVLGHKTLFGHRVASDARAIVQDRSSQDIPLAESTSPALKGRIQTALLPLGPWGGETVQQMDVPEPVVVPKK